MNGPSADRSGRDGQRTAPVARRLVPLAVLLLGLALFFAFGFGRQLSPEALGAHREALLAWARSAGMVAWLVYLLAYTAVVAFSIPGGAVMTVAGGFLFGPALGAALAVVGATLGAVALFLAARYALADSLRARAAPAIQRMKRGFNENAFSYLLFLRLVPVFPFWLVNLVPAFLGVRLATYAGATFFGIIPGTVVYALVGNGLGAALDAGGKLDLGVLFEPRFLAPIVGLAVLALVPVAYKKLRRAH